MLIGGRYRIVKKIGQGGMGQVFLAEDIRLPGKQWAVKRLNPEDTRYPEWQEELNILLRLNHPYLPHVVDYIPEGRDGYCYLVMDYIAGRTLLEIFAAAGNWMSWTSVVKYSLQLCECFKYLHHHPAAPIIYRDLKPANVMIDGQDHVRLIDFGIARKYKEGRTADTVKMGTPGFAAPEQYEDRQTDHRTDLFNLGAMMFYLLSGGHYYTAHKPLLHYRSDIPRRLDEIVGKLLQRDPDSRYQSAAELEQDLLAELAHTNRPQQADTVAPIGDAAPSGGSLAVWRRKWIVIAGCCPGAGATFAALSLARALNRFGVPHAFVEHPGNVPELFFLLDGEKNKPWDYRFLSDMPNDPEHSAAWTSGTTVWYPADPDAPALARTQAESGAVKMLSAIKEAVVIIDVSSHWEDRHVQEMMQIADAICFVADSFPSKFNSPRTRAGFRFAGTLKKSGKAVHLIANRCLPAAAQKEWLRSFPWAPLCRLPNIPYEAVFLAAAQGRLIQDHPDYGPELIRAAEPLARRIVPNIHGQAVPQSRRWLARWLGRS